MQTTMDGNGKIEIRSDLVCWILAISYVVIVCVSVPIMWFYVKNHGWDASKHTVMLSAFGLVVLFAWIWPWKWPYSFSIDKVSDRFSLRYGIPPLFYIRNGRFSDASRVRCCLVYGGQRNATRYFVYLDWRNSRSSLMLSSSFDKDAESSAAVELSEKLGLPLQNDLAK
jgi:hypothetical protein